MSPNQKIMNPVLSILTLTLFFAATYRGLHDSAYDAGRMKLSLFGVLCIIVAWIFHVPDTIALVLVVTADCIFAVALLAPNKNNRRAAAPPHNELFVEASP